MDNKSLSHSRWKCTLFENLDNVQYPKSFVIRGTSGRSIGVTYFNK